VKVYYKPLVSPIKTRKDALAELEHAKIVFYKITEEFHIQIFDCEGREITTLFQFIIRAIFSSPLILKGEIVLDENNTIYEAEYSMELIYDALKANWISWDSNDRIEELIYSWVESQ